MEEGKVLYHYSGCSTCKKAIAFLKSKGVAVELVDLVQHPPHARTLRLLWAHSGKPLDKLFNVSGQSYRDGGFKDRMKSMNELEKLDALAADGKLVKRPILDLDGTVLIGFDEAEWAAAIG